VNKRVLTAERNGKRRAMPEQQDTAQGFELPPDFTADLHDLLQGRLSPDGFRDRSRIRRYSAEDLAGAYVEGDPPTGPFVPLADLGAVLTSAKRVVQIVEDAINEGCLKADRQWAVDLTGALTDHRRLHPREEGRDGALYFAGREAHNALKAELTTVREERDRLRDDLLPWLLREFKRWIPPGGPITPGFCSTIVTSWRARIEAALSPAPEQDEPEQGKEGSP
jgi:hypothetical protein